jgi:hypothetical protein
MLSRAKYASCSRSKSSKGLMAGSPRVSDIPGECLYSVRPYLRRNNGDVRAAGRADELRRDDGACATDADHEYNRYVEASQSKRTHHGLMERQCAAVSCPSSLFVGALSGTYSGLRASPLGKVAFITARIAETKYRSAKRAG